MVIDAGRSDTAAVSRRFGIYQAAKYFNHFAEPVLGQDAGFCNTINLDTWKNLSPSAQKVFLDICEEYPFKFAEFDREDAESALKVIQSSVKVIDVPASVSQKWKSLVDVEKFREGWVEFAMKNTDVPEKRLRQILARYVELLGQMEEKYPQSW